MSDQLDCPMCGRNLGYTVAGQTPMYSQAVLIEYRGVYDGGLHYADASKFGCGRAWHRWPEGHHLRPHAEPYVEKWNQKVRERELNERLA